MSQSPRRVSLCTIVALLVLSATGSAQDRHRDDRGSRPSRSRASSDRGSREGSDRSGSGSRYNPFRSGSRSGGDAPARGVERATLGVPIREQSPARYDGRGFAPRERYGAAPVHSALSVAIASGGAFGGTSVAVGARIGGLRVGFTSYANPGPRGGHAFAYPFYAYDPYARGAVVVASPWYAYSYLPPYLDGSRVVYVDDYPSWSFDGWRTLDPDDRRTDPAVRGSIDDLRDAFEEASGRIADRLVPEEGDVAIFNGGKYDYSLNPDDFQKMFMDGVEDSKTVRYTILDARTRGDEVRVRARHEYTDSWGDTQSVVHRITLRRENGGDYVIREFGTE